jgi:hypothetical protein
MSKYATRWEPIQREEYLATYNDSLKVYSGFTSPEGCELSYRPRIMTTWGDETKELIKCDRTKESRDETEWTDKYWKAVEWETEDG